MTSIVWFRRDTRLDDNPAWSNAAGGGPVTGLFVVDPALYNKVSPRRQALLVAGVDSLDKSLQALGGRLRIEHGDPADVVPQVAEELGGLPVHVNAEVTPFGRARDHAVARHVELAEHEGNYLHPPGSVTTDDGNGYKVFTPFYKKWAQLEIRPHLAPKAVDVTDNPGAGLPASDPPIIESGEDAAKARLSGFLERVDTYGDDRDRPDLDRTSRLSVDLKYGWIGPRRVAHAVGVGTPGRAAFTRQLAWRDFYGHLMTERPDMAGTELREDLKGIHWTGTDHEFQAWCDGLTGYPLVDAGMRQLAAEGWIHNRVRMVVASFLVKDLLIDWRRGERFFRRHLLDADPGQNAGNWQWVAGTGTDAAPYFRVFNPILQSKKFDSEGAYIKRWVPELQGLDSPAIHEPWSVGPLDLAAAGVTLGVDYPERIVDHHEAKEAALAAYEAVRIS